MPGGGDRGKRVQLIVYAEQLPFHIALALFVECNGKPAVRGLPTGLPTAACSEPLNRCPAAAFEHPLEIHVAAVTHNQSVRWHCAYQMMELRLDRREIRKNIGVIEFEIIEDRGARRIVQGRGGVIEEGSVVLVRADDKEAGGADT